MRSRQQRIDCTANSAVSLVIPTLRPGRSAHQALRTLQNALWAKRLYWVIDIDI